jgi:tryptophan-rich sensory protein
MANVGRRAGRILLGLLLFFTPLASAAAAFPLRRAGEIDDWLTTLRRSPMTGPLPALAGAWALLLLLAGAALALFVDAAFSSGLQQNAFGPVCFFVTGLLFLLALLAANAAFVVALFRRRDLRRALRCLYAAMLLLVGAVLTVAPSSALAAVLLLPLGAGLFYAYRLQAYLVENNPSAATGTAAGKGSSEP